MNRKFLDRLFDAAGEGEGGGGTGTPPPNDPNAGAPPLTLDAILAGLSTKLPDLIKPLISTEVNGLGARFDKELKKLKDGAQQPPATPKPGNGNGDGSGNGNAGSDPFKADRERELEERLKAIEDERKAERTASQEKEADAEVKSAIGDFQWAEGEGKQIAYDYYRAKTSRDENGQLTIAGMPLSKFVKEHAPRHFKNFFQAREVGGSGSTGRNQPGASKASIDAIKPGMSKETEQAAVADILAAVSAMRNQG